MIFTSLSARKSRSRMLPESRKLSQYANVSECCRPSFRKRVIVCNTDCGIASSAFWKTVAQVVASFDQKDCSRSRTRCLVSLVSLGKLFFMATASAEVRIICNRASCARRTSRIARAYSFPCSIWLTVAAAYTSDEVRMF